MTPQDIKDTIEEIILMLQSNKTSKVNSALERLKQLKEEM